jgi:hypothetical protein
VCCEEYWFVLLLHILGQAGFSGKNVKGRFSLLTVFLTMLLWRMFLSKEA